MSSTKPGNLTEDGLQPGHGTDVADAGGLDLEVEDLGDLAVGRLLEVAEHQDLAIDPVEAVSMLDIPSPSPA